MSAPMNAPRREHTPHAPADLRVAELMEGGEDPHHSVRRGAGGRGTDLGRRDSHDDEDNERRGAKAPLQR
jgi:hypothetical protein